MRVSVNPELCQGHARCNAICPELFELDDLGYATTRDRDAPPALADAASDAERSCPEQAIRIQP